jgi:DNA mismatch repair protein MutS
MATAKKETPLMKQYNAIKAKHPGALLLFRVGDFYETFGEDAVKASKTLNIVLTKRANGSASHIELAGFPHHSLDTYLPKLVRAGNRVAICDQLEDPKSVKGIVKRGVTELVTPGLSMNDNVLDQRRNNYLAALSFGKESIGISLLDLSTGEFMVSQGNEDYIDKLLQSFNPSEVIYCKKFKERFESRLQDKYNTYCLEEWIFGLDYGYEKLTSHFKTTNLKGFGIEQMTDAICAAGAVLFYLEETEHKEVNHISAISRIEADKYVWLDKFTIRNLELLFAQQSDGVPLIDILDKTLTPMGARMLKKWLVLPLKDKAVIEERLSVVEAFVDRPELQDSLLDLLKQIGDLERLISKVSVLRVNPRELVQLKRALTNIGPIILALKTSENKTLEKYSDLLNPCAHLLEKIDNELKEDAPILSWMI